MTLRIYAPMCYIDIARYDFDQPDCYDATDAVASNYDYDRLSILGIL